MSLSWQVAPNQILPAQGNGNKDVAWRNMSSAAKNAKVANLVLWTSTCQEAATPNTKKYPIPRYPKYQDAISVQVLSTVPVYVGQLRHCYSFLVCSAECRGLDTLISAARGLPPDCRRLAPNDQNENSESAVRAAKPRLTRWRISEETTSRKWKEQQEIKWTTNIYTGSKHSTKNSAFHWGTNILTSQTICKIHAQSTNVDKVRFHVLVIVIYWQIFLDGLIFIDVQPKCAGLDSVFCPRPDTPWISGFACTWQNCLWMCTLVSPSQPVR